MARFSTSNVNPDLAKERQTQTFDTEILTRILDGGEWITNKRRELGKCKSSTNMEVVASNITVSVDKIASKRLTGN